MMGLYIGQEKKFKQTAVVMQLNVIPLLANVVVVLNKPEAVDLIMPLFVESLAEGDASAPSLMRLKVKLALPSILLSEYIHIHLLQVCKTIYVYLS